MHILIMYTHIYVYIYIFFAPIRLFIVFPFESPVLNHVSSTSRCVLMHAPG